MVRTRVSLVEEGCQASLPTAEVAQIPGYKDGWGFSGHPVPRAEGLSWVKIRRLEMLGLEVAGGRLPR